MPGEPPGTLRAVPDAAPPRITLWSYQTEFFEERAVSDLDQLNAERQPDRTLWLDVVGAPAPATLQAIGRAFALHPLSLEDIVSSTPRPKVEEYESYTFLMLTALAISDHVEPHRVGVFLGDGFVVSFEDAGSKDLDVVRDRIRKDRGRVRKSGADYLVSAMIDVVVDHYFPVVEEFDDRLESIEAEVLETRNPSTVALTRAVRYDLGTIRHAIFPLREVLVSLVHDGSAFVGNDTRVYLRDIYDHVAQLQDMVEFSREVAASLLESYISAVSLETNEVIRVLTIVATIFIPLTFITGVYGMNFKPESSPLNMPELDWYWGYPFSLGLMLGIAAGMLLFFRARAWIGSRRRR